MKPSAPIEKLANAARVMGIRLDVACVLLCAAGVLGTPARAADGSADLEFRQATRLPADSVAGRRVFERCAACHGVGGAGSSNGFVPRIAGQHFRVLIRQLVDYRHGRRSNAQMQEATADHRLTGAQEIADVATYVNLMEVSPAANLGTGLMAQDGVRVYDALCRGCHGAGARGSDAKIIPRLAGQNHGYLVRQFSDIAQGRRGNVSKQHVRLLSSIQYQEIVALSDYLSQILQ